jgi:hypothetical protein
MKRDKQCMNGIPFPSKEVTHSTNGEVEHDVHASSVNLVDDAHPIVDHTPVRIQQREIDWRVAYRFQSRYSIVWHERSNDTYCQLAMAC